jgi:hypothetical protein
MLLNESPIPVRRLADLEGGWNAYLVEQWALRLQECALDLRGRVAEIGPGFSDKIARSLDRIGFAGCVTLVEPNPAAAAWAADRYRRFLARAATAEESVASLGRIDGLSAILANHIFDDMIVSEHLTTAESAKLFGSAESDPAKVAMLREGWSRVLSSPVTDQRLEPVVAQLLDYFARSGASQLVVNHYESWFLRDNGLRAANECAQRAYDVMQKVVRRKFPGWLLRETAGPRGAVRWLIVSARAQGGNTPSRRAAP